MTTIPMPEPVTCWLDKTDFINKPCITTTQSEAYAAKRVREALEQAAQEADDWAMQYVEVDSSPHMVGDYIRALITKE